jgi:hypothetical protein
MALFLPLRAASHVVDALPSQPPSTAQVDVHSTEVRELFREFGNILGGAFLNPFADELGKRCYPNLERQFVAPRSSLSSELGEKWSNNPLLAIALEITLVDLGAPFRCALGFTPDTTFEALLRAAARTIED